MKKYRVLFVTPLPPPVHGSSIVSEFIKNSKLIKDEMDCQYVNLSTSRSVGEIGKFHIAKLFRFVMSYLVVLWKLLTHRYDLVYLAITVGGVGFLKDSPFVLMAKLFCKKVVVHHHNKGMSKYVDKMPYKVLYRLVYNKVKVILLSWNLFDDISTIVNKDDILICPNGLPPIVGNVSKKEDKKVPNILFLSNLIESKGVFVLLDACRIMMRENLKFSVTFVGGESKMINRDVLEKAMKDRGLTSGCGVEMEYVGPKYGKDKEYYWNNADIFVLPTCFECFPLVVIEAMQHKLPIVSTDEGGIVDIVDNWNEEKLCGTGFLVHSQVLRENCCNESLGELTSEKEFEKTCAFNEIRGKETAEALSRLVKDEQLRKKMGQAGYQKYLEQLTLDKFEYNMLCCLKSALDD